MRRLAVWQVVSVQVGLIRKSQVAHFARRVKLSVVSDLLRFTLEHLPTLHTAAICLDLNFRPRSRYPCGTRVAKVFLAISSVVKLFLCVRTGVCFAKSAVRPAHDFLCRPM